MTQPYSTKPKKPKKHLNMHNEHRLTAQEAVALLLFDDDRAAELINNGESLECNKYRAYDRARIKLRHALKLAGHYRPDGTLIDPFKDAP